MSGDAGNLENAEGLSLTDLHKIHIVNVIRV
jgi:hypothetical protein